MSDNSTNTGSVSSSSVDLQELSAIVRPQINVLMISHTFLSFLIPLVIALFHFSTPQGRRRPIFILNVTAIFFAFVVGALCDGLSIHIILEPLNPWPPVISLLIGTIGIWLSILVDITLFLRVISVYPLAHLGLLRFSLLIATPVLLKLARVINLVIFTKVLVAAMNGPDAMAMMGIVFISTPYIKIEWAAQVIDNTYASLAFLWKMRHQASKRVMTNSTGSTLTQRMQTLSRIALTNFVVPTMFSMAQFVCIYLNVDPLVLNQIILVNIMLATFGVAFATVWAGSTVRREAQVLDSKRYNTGSHLPMTVVNGSTGNSIFDDYKPQFGTAR